MTSKMTTNSQLSTTEPKKQKQKLNKQLEQEQKHRNGHHIESFQWGGEGGDGGKGTGNKKHNWWAQNRQGEVKNSIGDGKVKELIHATCGRELMWWDAGGREVTGQRGI